MHERKTTVRHKQGGHQYTGKNSPHDGKIVYKITNHEKIMGRFTVPLELAMEEKHRIFPQANCMSMVSSNVSHHDASEKPLKPWNVCQK